MARMAPWAAILLLLVGMAVPVRGGPTPDQLTLALPGANVLFVPYYVGVEKGIFLRHGIDLKLRFLTSPTDVIAATQRGDAQVGAGTWSGVAPAKVQGVDLKIFCLIVSDARVVNYDQFNGIVVRPGIRARSIADLAGLKIATSPGGGTDAYLRAHLARANILDKVTFLSVRVPDMLAALQRGADAAAAPEPFLSVIESELPGSRILIHGGGVNDNRVVAYSRGEWFLQNLALAERFWAASAESAQYARQRPNEAARATRTFLTGVDERVLEKALRYVTFDPRFSSKVMEGFVGQNDELLRQKKMSEAPKMEDLLAVSLMQAWPRKYRQFFEDLPAIGN